MVGAGLKGGLGGQTQLSPVKLGRGEIRGVALKNQPNPPTPLVGNGWGWLV
jgi:hypothetical protein